MVKTESAQHEIDTEIERVKAAILRDIREGILKPVRIFEGNWIDFKGKTDNVKCLLKLMGFSPINCREFNVNLNLEEHEFYSWEKELEEEYFEEFRWALTRDRPHSRLIWDFNFSLSRTTLDSDPIKKALKDDFFIILAKQAFKMLMRNQELANAAD